MYVCAVDLKRFIYTSLMLVHFRSIIAIIIFVA